MTKKITIFVLSFALIFMVFGYLSNDHLKNSNIFYLSYGEHEDKEDKKDEDASSQLLTESSSSSNQKQVFRVVVQVTNNANFDEVQFMFL